MTKFRRRENTPDDFFPMLAGGGEDITVRAVLAKRFNTSRRGGYDPAEVDDYLLRLARHIEEMSVRLDQLTDQVFSQAMVQQFHAQQAPPSQGFVPHHSMFSRPEPAPGAEPAAPPPRPPSAAAPEPAPSIPPPRQAAPRQAAPAPAPTPADQVGDDDSKGDYLSYLLGSWPPADAEADALAVVETVAESEPPPPAPPPPQRVRSLFDRPAVPIVEPTVNHADHAHNADSADQAEDNPEDSETAPGAANPTDAAFKVVTQAWEESLELTLKAAQQTADRMLRDARRRAREMGGPRPAVVYQDTSSEPLPLPTPTATPAPQPLSTSPGDTVIVIRPDGHVEIHPGGTRNAPTLFVQERP